MRKWRQDKDDIARQIEQRPSFAKIILKTKNDPVFLREWIEHHAAIVGHEKIIIADNGSTDAAVHDLYAEYGSTIIFFGYEGPPDNIHNPNHFEPLYRAIYKSSKKYCFLDTDERLVLADRGGWRSGSALFDYLKAQPDGAIAPTCLLPNLLGSRSAFQLFPQSLFDSSWVWGKPLISTRSATLDSILQPGHFLHTSQYPAALFSSDPLEGRLYVQHLSKLDRQQRISASVNKLVAMGFAEPSVTVDELLTMDLEGSPSRRRFLVEARQMLKWDGLPIAYETLPQGAVRFEDDGALSFSDAACKDGFGAFLDNCDAELRRILQLS